MVRNRLEWGKGARLSLLPATNLSLLLQLQTKCIIITIITIITIAIVNITTTAMKTAGQIDVYLCLYEM